MPFGGATTPSNQGDVTQRITNPTQEAQLPFLSQAWQNAQNLSGSNPLHYYPNQTLADFNPSIGSGLLGGIQSGQGMRNYSDMGSQRLAGFGNGGAAVQNSPAYGQLTKSANGDFLNSNPYLDKMFGGASDAVTRAYQTATAPQTDAAYEQAGRYGGGALANSRSQNEQDLGRTLGNLSSNIYGQNYANERQLMQRSQGLLQEGYQAGNQQQLGALGMIPGMQGLGLTGANAELAGGQGLTGMDQAKIADQMARFYGEQIAPWQTNQQYLGQIGQPTTGSSTNTSPLLGPSPLSSALGAGMGGLSLYNGLNSTGLFGSGGLGSLFGGGAAAGMDFGGGGAAMGIGDTVANAWPAALALK